jgi:hypothetical protein
LHSCPFLAAYAIYNNCKKNTIKSANEKRSEKKKKRRRKKEEEKKGRREKESHLHN